MAQEQNTPKINEEEILFIEVEMDDSYKPETVNAAEATRRAAINKAFDIKLMGKMMDNVRLYPCSCQLQHRDDDRKLVPELTQADLDNYAHSAVVTYYQGLPVRIAMHMRQCKTCKKLEFYGDINTVTGLVADRICADITQADIADAIDAVEDMGVMITTPNPVGPPSGDAPFILEDVDSGERTEAGSLAEALFGEGAKDMDVKAKVLNGADEDERELGSGE